MRQWFAAWKEVICGEAEPASCPVSPSCADGSYLAVARQVASFFWVVIPSQVLDIGQSLGHYQLRGSYRTSCYSSSVSVLDFPSCRWMSGPGNVCKCRLWSENSALSRAVLLSVVLLLNLIV